ncbi:CxC2 domain-containing protein [Favolaschia claudopus]|uniref:CxC2 domain-containing protein n=1 Tax=Favolaschia claudopus TaxID=2862362 RepID=A0AAV9ZYT3_9AGAR
MARSRYSDLKSRRSLCIVSSLGGKAHFPVDRDYRAHLKENPGSTEKSTCNYLKAVNKQDKKKFKNMAITGTVNAQCSHVFILSSVDLHYGEKFSNGDYALVSSLRLYNGRGKMTFELRFEIDDVDEMATYDIACEYTIHLESRIAKNFPDVLVKVKKMRWGVPSLHIQGHQEDCMYKYGTAYLSCVGHLHGETAEQWWPEANQLGPHVRQMNNGHRQDTIIDHQNDWNYKKTAGIGEMLASELRRGKQQFEEKLRHFNGLSASAGDLVKKWKIMDRTPRRVGKDIISVYRHNTIPSQQAIYQRMLAEDERFEGSMVPRNRIARFINDALMIEEDQCVNPIFLFNRSQQDLQSLASEIAKRRSKLKARLTAWRREQREIMPQVGDKVALQSQQLPSIQLEHERLFLPSDFVEVERQELRLGTLGSEEARWREGQAFGALRATQSVVKTLRALLDHTARHDRQQKQRSRAGDQLRDIIRRRDFRMGTYDVARKAMIALGSLEPGPQSSFPPLSIADTFMKSVIKKRQLGDSHLTDGRWFTMTASSSTPSQSTQQSSGSTKTPPIMSGTQMPKRKINTSRTVKVQPVTAEETAQKAEARSEGWLWRDLGKMGKLTSEEMDEWSQESDRVQWFRAEAEVERWREHVEMRLAELLRSIRSFRKWDTVWTELADGVQAGYCAYAKQKAHMNRCRAERCEALLEAAGYKELLQPGASLVQYVIAKRARQPLY